MSAQKTAKRSVKATSLWSELRQREVRVLLAALVIAVTTVATITLFSSHLQRTLVTSANAFLAADRKLESENGTPIDPAWVGYANEQGLETATMVEFSTMIATEDRFQMVAVKAVSPDYPLRGSLEIQDAEAAERREVASGPSPGEAWINPRLLRLLNLEVGDTIDVGRKSLTVSEILMREPDGGFSIAAIAPRLMMNEVDVAATEVLQPGSRVEYSLLLAGPDAVLANYHEWLKPQLSPSHEWESVRDGRRLSESLEKAERFLLLGGSLAVLLAAVAVAVASRQYALRQRDPVALLKTLGLTGPAISRLYLRRLAAWAVIGCVGGLLLASPLYLLMAHLLARFLEEPVELYVDGAALLPAVVTGLVALFAFAYPPLHRLRKISAMRVLRSQPGEGTGVPWQDLAIATIGIFGLVWFYAGEFWLALALLLGFAGLMALLAVVAGLMLLTLRRLGGGRSAWRLALVGLYRHRQASLAQISVFSMTLMLASTLILVRTSLLADWQAQLPEDAPNYFLINVAPDDITEVDSFWEANGVEQTLSYPMVRGRLTQINGEEAADFVDSSKDVNALRRELNLTYSDDLPSDNRIIEGRWFSPGTAEGVSVEQELAGELGVEVGDVLGFTVGSEKLSAEVTSIRTVQWDSMQPNFYMIFPEQSAISGLSSTWLSAFHLPQGNDNALSEFTRTYPTVSVLELDAVTERIRSIIGQVSQAIEAILALILAAALVVMAAVVSATAQERQREGALLRTLGGRSSVMIRSTMLEFFVIGVISGVVGSLMAELAVWGLQYRMFQGEFLWHWPVLVLVPAVSGVLLAVFGRIQLREVLQVSPMLLLRRLE